MPGDRPVSELLTELSTLYRQTETAAAAYHSAGERLKTQRNRARKLNRQLARTRGTVDRNRAEAGRLARAQYRNGTAVLPPDAALLLADDPVQALANAHALERAVSNQARTVKRLTSVERREHALATKARRALERQRRLSAGRKAHRDRAQARLRQVEKLLTSLPADRLAQLRELERTRTARSQSAFLADGTLGGPADATRTPTRQGARALSYALAQRGKPYRWGAAGPRAFDCSGLTARAWARAGVRIPRSSQQQWRKLKRVPLRELRPGDLVVYYAHATHVGVYAGHGKVVHAPRPGSRVTLAPIATHPILGAVRPS